MTQAEGDSASRASLPQDAVETLQLEKRLTHLRNVCVLRRDDTNPTDGVDLDPYNIVAEVLRSPKHQHKNRDCCAGPLSACSCS